MLPIYKCSSCGAVFVEWTVGDEHGTPWYFIQGALNDARPSSIRASLICPRCGTDNGMALWFLNGPLAVLHLNLTATLLAVTNLTVEDAVVTEKVAQRAREMHPNEVIVTFGGAEKLNERSAEDDTGDAQEAN